eukprot:365315-Chlamydomonas_euryale.AAC.12
MHATINGVVASPGPKHRCVHTVCQYHTHPPPPPAAPFLGSLFPSCFARLSSSLRCSSLLPLSPPPQPHPKLHLERLSVGPHDGARRHALLRAATWRSRPWPSRRLRLRRTRRRRCRLLLRLLFLPLLLLLLLLSFRGARRWRTAATIARGAAEAAAEGCWAAERVGGTDGQRRRARAAADHGACTTERF